MYSMRACQLLARRALAASHSGRMASSSFHATAARHGSNLATLKELRAVSGAPMMECKKALEASDNDMDKAMDWLRRE